MCGFAGFVAFAGATRSLDLTATVARMADSLIHRGPDDRGIWIDRAAGLAMGHRRLAIIDLSAEGHQPMISGSGRFVVVYNGEIYNFRVLRRELENLGHRFRGHSDTEALLGAVDQWGLDETLRRIAGMFAFALWDRRSRILHLVRDRLGKKPLYFGWAGRSFLFGSELKAFHQHPDFAPVIDRDALTAYLRYSYVPNGQSIYEGVHKLPPGYCLSLCWSEHGWQQGGELLAAAEPYWRLRAVAEDGMRLPLDLTEGDAVEQLDGALSQAVALRMIADVPLGAFLSGGIDSSTVVALMQKQSSQPVRTFTIGFNEASYDEAVDARRIARHLGTDHTELYISAEQTRAVIPQLADVYDEPFADESQIPTLLLARLARQQVTVALSGDGGDELFGGYSRHFLGPRLWRGLRRVPVPARARAAAMLTRVSPQAWDAMFDRAGRLLPRAHRLRAPGDQLHKLARILAVGSPEAMYRQLVSRCDDPGALVIGGAEPPSFALDSEQAAGSFAERMMYYDGATYLPDDVLAKVDRATMAVSLEARSPLLDHGVVELAWRLPLHMKLRDGRGKWLLRQVLDRYVPARLVERPKQGFRVPIGSWLRGPLREWGESLLDRRRLDQEGFFHAELIRRRWSDHVTGRRDCSNCLWNVLMFQGWQERWRHRQPADRPETGRIACHAWEAAN